MKRRTFLTAAAGLAASPLLVRRAFAQAPSERVEALFDAYRRSRRSGRPLLVIVIPKEESEYWRVGRAWGEYINHGTEPQLAPLALFEPACAKAEDLAKLAPQAELGPDTRFVVLATDAVPARATSYRVELAEGPPGWARTGAGADSFAEIEAREEAAVDQRIAALAAAVADAAKALGRTFFEPPDRAALAADPRDATRVDVEAHPGWSWRWSLDSDPAGRLTERLADVARARFRDEVVPGSRWARSSGCGVDVEGGPPSRIGCGMGHTPRRSVRFLYFFDEKKD